MSTSKSKGFTLIELMIVVAIIGILASVALPAYRAYIQTSNSAKVNLHYDVAIDFARSEFQRTRTMIQMGAETRAQADARLAGGFQFLIALRDHVGVDAFNTGSPEGFFAFDAAVRNAEGTVGVSSAGDILSGTLAITVTRPLYGDFAGSIAQTETVNW